MKYSFYNIVEVNLLETVLGEEGVEGWEGKRKTNIVLFHMYIKKVNYWREKGDKD